MGVYYDRTSKETMVICETCGEKRWGEGDAGFNARIEDKSGTWCWDFRWSLTEPTPCNDCDKPAEPEPECGWLPPLVPLFAATNSEPT